MKKFILLSLSITIFIFSSAIAFADSDSSADSSAELPQSALLSPVTDENEIAIDDKLREASVLLAANSQFTANDIYNLLNACRISINGNTNLRVYDSSVVDAVNSLRSYISYVNDSLNATGHGSLADIQVDTLTAINNVLSTLQYDTDSETITAIDMLRNIFTAQVTDSQFSSFASDVSNRWITENNQFTSISNDFAHIHSLLNDIHNDLTGVTSAINNNGSTLHTDFNTANNNIANILTTNQHIDSDMHSLKQWLDDTFYFNSSDSSISYLQYHYNGNNKSAIEYPFTSSLTVTSFKQEYFSGYLETGSTYTVYYPIPDSFTVSLNNTHGTIVCLCVNQLPTLTGQSQNFYKSSDYITSVSLKDNCLVVSFDLTSSKITKYKYVAFSNPLNVLFTVSASSGIPSFDGIPYIPIVVNTSKSYFADYKDTLDKFKDLYASDDLIAAKDAQQDYEDSALNDFTGQGSAAVPKSGLSDVKGLQGSVTNSLNSGASASDIVNVLGNDTYLEFFSQSISDDINGVNNGLSSHSQQNTRLKSSSNSGDEIVDLLGGRDAELQSILGGNKW